MYKEMREIEVVRTLDKDYSSIEVGIRSISKR